MNRKQIVAFILALVFLFTSIPAFADTQTKLTVVTTIFPQYDFVRAIAGDTGAVDAAADDEQIEHFRGNRGIHGHRKRIVTC